MELNNLRSADPQVYEAVQKEKDREHDKIVLIASENRGPSLPDAI